MPGITYHKNMRYIVTFIDRSVEVHSGKSCGEVYLSLSAV